MRERCRVSRLAGVCLLVAVVLSGQSAAAALPGKATLISPSGNAGTDTPTYSWNADPNSTWYYLWVDDSTGNRIAQWYTGAQAACPGGGICYATPDVDLAPGSARWWIQTWGPSGYGPWSDSMAFTTPVPDPPGKAVLISPSGTIGTNTPGYAWNADPKSSWYYLWVDDSTGNRITQWYSSDKAGCLTGKICSVTPDIALAPGATKWWIQTWNPSGCGPWSDVMAFTVPAPVPPGKAVLISPSGTIGTNAPNYTWNADPNSTWYYLWVNDSTGTRLQKWYTAAQAGCPGGTGTCLAWPGVYLWQGSAKWWIQTWSPNGYGPWTDGMLFEAPAPVSGSMVDLGTLGGSWSEATLVSADGSVVAGAAVNNDLNQRAFRWTELGGMVDLGTLGSWSSYVTGLSMDGSVIVGCSSTNAGLEHAFRWTQAGGMVDLGTLPGGFSSEAAAVSADGSVVVGSSSVGAGNVHAFRWTQTGGMVDLGTLGGLESRAVGVSMDGSVVAGTSKNVAGNDRAFRWTQAGGMVDLGNPGELESRTTGVSPDGTVVVGYSVDSMENKHAFRWTQAGGMVDLGTLGSGWYSYPRGLSDDGSVVVGDSVNNDPEFRAFRWTQAGGMVDLGTLGGSQSAAVGVSADGGVVVGYSSNSVGNQRAFRWTQAGGMVDLGTLGGSDSQTRGVSADGSAVVGFARTNTETYHAFRWK